MTRYDFGIFLNELGLVGYAAEIGVHRAKFAEQLLNTWHGKKLYLIDPYYEQYGDNVIKGVRSGDKRAAKGRMLQFPSTRYQFVDMPSSLAAKQIVGIEFDFVYIDGNHADDFVRDDINNWWLKIKPGGILAGHDYTHDVFRVDKIVDAFADSQGLDVHLTEGDHPLSWCLRKPIDHQDKTV
jgi:hypothetical protein